MRRGEKRAEEGDGLDAALRLLSIRARSRHELELALRRRGVAPERIAATIEKLAGWGYLDDARFARDRAAGLLRSGRFGATAVVRRLLNHGIPAPDAKRAVAAAERELGHDPRAAAKAVLERRRLYGRPLTLKEKGKAARLLLGRGFSRDVIGALVGELPLDPDGGDD